MSSTRTNTNGTFRPERWASSPEFDRPLKANLVAARCSVLEPPELRELVWFMQFMSLQRGGLRWLASEVVPDSVVPVPEIQEEWIARLCLDPETNAALERIAPRLRELLAGYARRHGEGGALTQIGAAINEGLDYCSQARCLVMIAGNPRLGKTWAARRWCAAHPGRARYCQVPSSADDLAFFTALAAALGITIESNAKTKNLRPRIEAALVSGGLTLVLDEAANLYPSHNYRLARPSRISWLMTALINQGVSVALLVTPQFFNTQADYVSRSGWAAAQFVGRIARFVSLPEKLSLDDLEKIARAWLPHGNQRCIAALADTASLSQRHAAAIEHACTLANYFAQQGGRDQADWPDIQRAIKSGVPPTDTALAAVVKNACRSESAVRSRN